MLAVNVHDGVDQDFIGQMIPHHQEAIDTAREELRHGHNEQLRRIAQETIVEQQTEIAVMPLVYVPNAVLRGTLGTDALQALELAGNSQRLSLSPVTLFVTPGKLGLAS